MKRPALFLIVLLALAGCRFGPSLKNFEPAHSPGGAEAILMLDLRNLRGELLALRDDGLVVLAKDELVFVPFEAIQHGRLAQKGAFIRNGSAPDERARERLRLLSRYPQGLSADVEARLLAAYGQDELTTVR